MFRLVVAFALLLPFSAQTVVAKDEDTEWAEEGRHDIGVFVGATFADSDVGASIGLDYEYRLDRIFGIGGVVEYTGSDFRDGIIAATAYWHPWSGERWKDLKVYAAAGTDIQPADKSSSFLIRIGAEYGFALRSGYEIAPAFNIDLTDEVAYVIGVTFAKGF